MVWVTSRCFVAGARLGAPVDRRDRAPTQCQRPDSKCLAGVPSAVTLRCVNVHWGELEMADQWSNFEAGWRKYQAAEAADKPGWLMGGSYETKLRWKPAEELWIELIDPEDQTSTILGVQDESVHASDAAPDAWLKVTKAYGKIKAQHPAAIWSPNSFGTWETLRFPNPPGTGTPTATPSGKKTPLELARERAQAERQRELAYVHTEFAANRMDVEEYNRRLKAIYEKYKDIT